MSDSPQRPNPTRELMRMPGPTFVAVVGQVFPWSLISAIAIVLLGCVTALVWRAFRGESFSTLLDAAAFVFISKLIICFFILFFSWGVLTRYRPLQDRSFTVLGFLATFFGLGMLLIFFAQLGYEVVNYFKYTPLLIERRNAELEFKVANAEKELAFEIANCDALEKAELEVAADDAEKAKILEFYKTKVRPRSLSDFEKTRLNVIQERDSGIRLHTDPLSLLWYFLTNYPSHEPQDVGIFPALLGSLMVALITILFAVPVGVGAALYLEEYRSNNWINRVIQVNINNLAGVPSVVYGILGAYIFVELIFKHVEEFDPTIAARNILGGGLTLGLLTLPVVIVASQESIRAVPSSLRQAAYALGATRWQVIWHQVLPMSLPGILTGTILALSRAIGEASPLVLFGANLLVSQKPSLFSRFTILPMQIFGWSDRPGPQLDGETIPIWQANAGMASVVLLIVLLTLNAIAILLRNQSQKRVAS